MQKKYKVEEGIPLPEPYRNTQLYPFKEMKVEASFAINGGAPEVARVRASIAHFVKNNKKYKFTVRKYNLRHRCWRLE